MQPPPLIGYYCSVPFDIPCDDILNLRNKYTSINRTVNGGPNSVLNIEVSLYRTAYCGPSGVHIIEVSLYTYAYSTYVCVYIRTYVSHAIGEMNGTSAYQTMYVCRYASMHANYFTTPRKQINLNMDGQMPA